MRIHEHSQEQLSSTCCPLLPLPPSHSRSAAMPAACRRPRCLTVRALHDLRSTSLWLLLRGAATAAAAANPAFWQGADIQLCP